MSSKYTITVIAWIGMSLFTSAFAQIDSSDNQKMKTQIQNLEKKLDQVESKASRADKYIPFILILFGAFSALWAQNTGRNPWLWFFLGYVFCIITVLVILSKNSGNKQQSLY